ncbi:hypothetical protein Mgra_00003150 [Meloidogyne graminicola]|uniref:Uncharacterized protein n=1 Tax=Meloidogyne graminicola TaxID=189291 RepID=A0A8S9ZVU9_9BILA|nr:hypothetical protein Mgra_00003150 [Meloidogyne graminicola]
MCDQNMEQNREKFQKLLQSSLIAYGSDGTVLFEFIKDFKNDWQQDITYYVQLLGYPEGLDGLIALMKSFPKDVIVEELPSGLVRFKPIPTEETIDNLNLIDKSNKEITEHRERKARMNQMNQRIFPFRMSSVPPPIYAPPSFNQSQPIPLAQHHPQVPQNFVPPYHRSYILPGSRSKAKPIISENSNLISLGVRQPFSQQQNGDDRHSRNRTNSVNIKEDRMRNGRSSPPSFSRATTPFINSLNSSVNDLTELEKPERDFLLNIGKSRPILGQTFEQSFPENNDYFDEDFRTPASDDSATLTEASSRIGSVSSLNGLVDSNIQSGDILPSETEESDVEEGEIIDDSDDEDDIDSIISDDSDLCVCFDEFEETSELLEKNVCNYIDRLKNEFQPPQADLSRLLYLFQINDGFLLSSKIDDFKRLYEKEFGCALSSKELNRLLGCPTNMRIVGESFKKAAYPASSFFRVIQEKSSSQYTIKLRRCLTGEFVDPSIYFARVPTRIIPAYNKILSSSSCLVSLPKIPISVVTIDNLIPSTLNIPTTKTVEKSFKTSTTKTSLNSKLDFLQISSKVTSFLRTKNGEVLLKELFEYLNKTLDFNIIKTKMQLLGYLNEFLSEICEILIKGYYLIDYFCCYPLLRRRNFYIGHSKKN